MMMSPDEKGKWLAARAGRLTSSRMATAMDFLKNGAPSKARSDYMRELIAERETGLSIRHYVSPAMEHGLAYEGDACMAYEAATGELVIDPRTVTEYGLFFHRSHVFAGNFAASPDGLLGRDGLIETKCPTPGTFIGWVLAGIVPLEHEPQMLAQLACTGRKWCEFVAFEPRIRDPKRRLFIRRYEPKPERIAEIEAAAEKFLDELDECFSLYVERAA